MDVKSGSLTDVARLCAAFARETHEPTTGCRRLFHCIGDWLLENAGLFQMLDFLSLAAGKKFQQFFFLPSENEENKKLCSAAAPSRIQRFTEPIIPETWKRAVLILDYGVRARARALCSHQNLLGVQGEDGFAGRIAALVTVWVLQLENWGFWKESLDFNNTYLFICFSRTSRVRALALQYSPIPQRVFPERWGDCRKFHGSTSTKLNKVVICIHMQLVLVSSIVSYFNSTPVLVQIPSTGIGVGASLVRMHS